MQFNQDDYLRLRGRAADLISARRISQRQVQETSDKIKQKKIRLSDAEKARVVIQTVARDTQQALEFHISNLVTTALKAIDTDWPEFVTRIEIRRNQMECDLLFKEDDEEYKPKDGAGGGPQDIASFVLRIAYWSLNKNRPVFIFDEPFRNVSPNYQENVSEMVSMISNKIGIQIIMVSHADDINIAADKTFLTTKKNKESIIEEEG